MITEMRSLQGICKVCGKRADYEITLTNDDLPEGYMRSGARVEYYCLNDLPQYAKDAWNFNIPDLPDQQL